MKQFTKTVQPLRWFMVILLVSTVFIACESKEEKAVETTKETTIEMEKGTTDSLPKLDTDSNSVTKPETIKN